MYNEKVKNTEIESIKKALIDGKEEEAKVLYKYSKHITVDEYEEIKRSLNNK